MLVYIEIREGVTIHEGKVLSLGDIAGIVVAEANLKHELESLTLDFVDTRVHGIKLISSSDIIRNILENYPNLRLDLIGKDEIIVEVKEKGKISRKSFKLGLLAIIITGAIFWGWTIIGVPYSTGLVIGMLIFFYHFGKDKKRVEYGPLEEISEEISIANDYTQKELSTQKDK